MKKLKIEIPEGYEIDQFDKEAGEVTFQKIKPKITPEKLFFNIFDECIVKFGVGDYSDYIYYSDDDGDFLVVYIKGERALRVGERMVFSIFQSIFHLTCDETKSLISKLFSDYFNVEVLSVDIKHQNTKTIKQ